MIHTDLEIPYQGRLLAGVDEAGRGPLAGPVIAAAVILDPDRPVEGINDSKKLSASKREYLAERIKSEAVCWSVGRADVSEIDNLNILQATMLAMSRAVAALHPAAEYILVDGNRCPEVDCAARAIIKGDQQVMAIAAASIIAKVARDEEMLLLHDRYPCYGFNQHKGYGTREHLSALEQHGASPVHRASFAPVRKVIKGTSA